jgi:hypothetical protein
VSSFFSNCLTNRLREAYFEKMKDRAAVDSDQQNVKDLEIINRCAGDLNEEALDVLDNQVALRSVEIL